MILLLGLLGSAAAQDEGCTAIYTPSEFTIALDEIDRLLEKADVDRAINALRSTEDLLPCLDARVDKRQLAEFGRSMALASFYQQDEIAATRWGRMFKFTDAALSSDNRVGWGALPDGHPLLIMIEEAGEPPIGGPGGKGLNPPKKGAIFLNGVLVTKAEARAEVPFLVQVFNEKGWPISGQWQDGSAFPDALLGPAGVARIPSWYDPVSDTIKPKGKPPKITERNKKKSNFPATELAIGGGLIVVAGVLDFLAAGKASRLKCDPTESPGCPTTAEELTTLRTQANLFTLGAGVALVGGIGVGVSGFLLEGDTPSVVFRGRF